MGGAGGLGGAGGMVGAGGLGGAGGMGGAGGLGGFGGGDGTPELWVCLPGHLEKVDYVPATLFEICTYSLDCDLGLICVCIPGANCDPEDALRSGPSCQALCDPTLNSCPVVPSTEPGEPPRQFTCTDLGYDRGFCDPTSIPVPG